MEDHGEKAFDFANASVYDLRGFFAKMDTLRDADKAPPADVYRWTDIDYAFDGTPNHTLDVYYPVGTGEALPVILNIHGGGWTYGHKGQYQYYCMALAQQGFTVVNCNYRLAPEYRFPAPLEDVCMVMQWMKNNAAHYYMDLDRFFITGDSAGAQIASQVLVMLTNPEYQGLFEFPVPNLTVRAAALNCGVYDLLGRMFDPAGNPIPPGMHYMPENYGERFEQLDVLNALTEDYPPVYLMGSVNDPISKQGLEPFHALIKDKGVSVKAVWFGQDNPKLGHVFHINVSLPEAALCIKDEIAFFKEHC